MADNTAWGALVSFFGAITGNPELGGVGSLIGVEGTGSGTSSITAAVGAVWETVTNYRMWRSLGWLFLGILVMVLGLLIWNRKAIGSGIKTATEAVPAVV